MTNILPTRFAEKSEEQETLTLVPMGAARLRITAFPNHTDYNGVDPDCEE